VAEESDGIEEAFEGQLRVMVTAAGQIGERIARAREEAQRRVQAASEQEARELAGRLAAEQRAARVELGNVYRSQWWDGATSEQVANAYQVARAWSQEDPEAVRAEVRIRDELRTRYGVDVDQAHADPAAVQAAVERAGLRPGAPGPTVVDEAREYQQARAWAAQHAPDVLESSDTASRATDSIDGLREANAILLEAWRAHVQAERTRAAADDAEAVRLLQQADREDARAEQARAAADHEPDPDERARALAEAEQRSTAATGQREDGRALYDSAERRDATASELEAKGIDREVVATRMRADVSQAKPATEAVQGAAPAKGAKARRTRGRGSQAQRTGLAR